MLCLVVHLAEQLRALISCDSKLIVAWIAEDKGKAVGVDKVASGERSLAFSPDGKNGGFKLLSLHREAIPRAV